MNKFIRVIKKTNDGTSTKFEVKEIKELLEDEPNAIFCLYRLVGTQNYTEKDCDEICEYLLNKEDIFKTIKPVTYAGVSSKDKNGWVKKAYRENRRNGYPQTDKMKSECERKKFNNKPLDNNIGEKHLAMRFFSQERINSKVDKIERLGYVLDYEMPIGGSNKQLYTIKEGERYKDGDCYGIEIPKGTGNLFSTGNCDLIAYDDVKREFLILELKDMDNSEPLLRAVLEAYTYKLLLNKNEAAESLIKKYPEIIKTDDIKWRTAPLLYMKGHQYEEEKHPQLKKFMKKKDIDIIWYEIENEKIVIRKPKTYYN